MFLCIGFTTLFLNKFINTHFLHFSVLISSGVSINGYNLNKQMFFRVLNNFKKRSLRP